MDLSERQAGPITRHPWETSRVAAIEQLVRRQSLRSARVLDVGCGDGYLARELYERLGVQEIVAQDIHLDEELAAQISSPSLRFVRSLDGLDYRADLVLLLDVLEHLDRPRQLLGELARQRLAPGGRILLTVPAFQGLFTQHDVALHHMRRYSRQELVDEVTGAGLVVLDSGYLFATLLLPRALSALRERLLPKQKASATDYGVGTWRAPRLVTRAVHSALMLDNSVCLAAHGVGLNLPGLSVWLTCTTPS